MKFYNENISKNENAKIKPLFIFKISILSFLFFFNFEMNNYKIIIFLREKFKRKKRIGIVGVLNEQNVGNNLVKFSMFTKLKEYGFEPTIISFTRKNENIDFLRKTVDLTEISKNLKYSQLKEKDYDILMVNSDQTWNNFNIESLYDHGFLRFAENWTIPKFVYAASLGIDYWRYTTNFDKRARALLKNFKGISLRERGSISLVKNHLGIKPLQVLDPTFLIDKKYYLDLIKDFKKDFTFNIKYLFVYILDTNKIIEKFIKIASQKLNYKKFRVETKQINYTENFLFGINISEAVITDSFHGTVFSIIFKKPFISFINSKRGRLRFYSLNETFNLGNRIIFSSKNQNPDINLLKTPLSINQTFMNSLKDLSITFLRKNLGIY